MKGWFRRPNSSVFVALTPAERVAILGSLLFMALSSLPFVIADGDPSRFGLYGAFLGYLAALALPLLLPGFHPGIFHPVVFYVAWVGIQGLLRGELSLAVSGLEYHRALGVLDETRFNWLIAESFLLDTTGLLCLYLGYAMMWGMPLGRFPSFRAAGLRLKSVLWVVASAVGLLMIARIGGGLDQVLMQRGIAPEQRIEAQIGGHWKYLATIGAVAPVVWLACDKKAIGKLLFWCVLLAALAIKFAATGSRGGIITPVIIIGGIYVLQHQTVPYRAVAIGVALALLAVGGLGEYRAATQQAARFEQVRIESGPSEWMQVALEEMQRNSGEKSGQLAILGRVPKETPHLWGESYLSLPFIFVPSALVGDKPAAGGELNAARIFGRPLTGIPPEPVGEAYWNFSYVGVVAIFLFYGALLKLIAATYRKNAAHPLVLVVFVYTLFYMKPHTPSLYDFGHAVVPAVVMLGAFVGCRGRQQSRSGDAKEFVWRRDVKRASP